MSTFGKFELLTSLAKGGMAEVYLARQTSEGRFERLVVIKRILPQYADEPRFVELFLEEARIAALLDHPNVIPIYDFGSIDDTYFIAMPYVQGLTVSTLLRTGGALPLEEAVEVVRQTLQGLEYVHDLSGLDGEPLRLVHRDVSPSNLMINDQGRVLLLDFGVATVSDSTTFDTGSIKGKLAYMSPEQIEAKDLDRRGDLFSLGVVFFELLIGARLFKRRSDVEMIRAVTEEPIPDVQDYDPEVPGAISDVISRALARDPVDRFPDATTMLAALDAAASQLELATSPATLRDYLVCTQSDQLRDRQEETRLARQGQLPGDAATIVDVPQPRSTRPPSSDVPRWRLPLVLTLVLAALAALAVGAFRLLTGEEAPSGEPLTMALTPYLPDDVIQRDWAPVLQYLEDEVGRPINSTVTVNYEQAVDALLEGDEVDLAELTAYPYLLALRRNPDLRGLASPISSKVTTYESYLVVRRDDPAQRLADMEGRRICYVDQTSTSGFLMPRVMVRKAGRDPDEFFESAQFSGNHVRALRDLLAGRCDVAAVTSPTYLSAGVQGVSVAEIRILQVSPSLPNGVICASERLPRPLVERLRRALLDFDIERDLGRRYLSKQLPLTGFTAVENVAFDDLAREVELIEASGAL